jgi:threonine dehydrogenase-like Zn-dependent dehydrogenase
MVYLGRTGLRAPVMLDTLVTMAAGIHGARGHSGGGCFPGILRLLESGRLPLAAMITARVPFARAVEALDRSCTREDAKILVTMGDGAA